MIDKVVKKVQGKLKDGNLKEILTGSSIAFILRIFGYGIGYVNTFVISKLHGPRGMGIYGLSLSVLMILEMFGTLGIKTSIMRFIGQFNAEKSDHKIRDFYKKVCQLVIPVSIVFSVILVFVAETIADLLFNNPLLGRSFYIIAVLLPVFAIGNINIEIVRGLKQIKFSEYLRNINIPLFNVLLLVLLNFFVINVYLTVVCYSCAVVITFCWSMYSIRKQFKQMPKVEEESAYSKLEILRISAPMILTAFSLFLMGKIDVLMLGAFKSVEDVGIYSVCVKLGTVTAFVLQAVNRMVQPKFAEYFHAKDHESLMKTVNWSGKIIFWASIPIVAVLLLFPKLILSIFGSEFTAGKMTLITLTIGQFINVASGSIGSLMNMTGKQKILRNIVFFAVILNVCLNYLLIPIYSYTGAAIATAISMSLWNLSAVVYLNKKEHINTLYVPILWKYIKKL